MDVRYSRINDENGTDQYTSNMAISGKRRILWLCLAMAVLAIICGFLIGWFTHVIPGCPTPNIGNVDPKISARLMSIIDKENIRKHLRAMTNFTHMAGTPEEDKLEQMVRDLWTEQGLTVVNGQPYNVLLSFPNHTDPSWAEILASDGSTIFRTSVEEEVMTPEQRTSPPGPPFHAYAVPGDVTAELIYANSATEEDFLLLRDEYHVNITGKIVIARYGSSYRGDKVKFAAQFGVAVILLYMDPKDFTSPGQPVFPHSKWLPGSASQRGTILTGNGDPLTPNYPSTNTAYRVKDRSTTWLPKIPSHPISYDDAYQFLSRMSGPEAPSDWQGGFNFSYHIGPGFNGTARSVRVRITQSNEIKPIRNIFGIINGTVEPDRYVLLGNHRDAWTYGGIDPTSATAAMVELSRAFMQLVKEGWKPKRTIIFCSWGAEEFGLLGSVEFVEDYVKVLVSRAVAYLNVDYIMDGSDSLTVGAMPTLRDLIYNSAKKIRSPHDSYSSLYDDWLKIFPSDDFKGFPELDSLGDSSDFGGFIFAAGISCYDAWYTTKENDGYPLYHTAYDGFDLYNNIIDPEFKVTLAMTQFWGETVLALTDESVLPLNVSHYATVLKLFVTKLDEGYGKILQAQNISLDDLHNSAVQLYHTAVEFHEQLQKIKSQASVYDIRRYNDQLMMFDRAFIDPAGLPLNPVYRHVVYAPSQYNSYAGTSFPGLTDLLHQINATSSAAQDDSAFWDLFRRHLATILYCFRAANSSLKPVTDFIYA